MTVQKNALLLFSKPPIPGLVKTRLTQEFGGPFTPQQSASFFNCTMFDVLEVCCQALDRLEAQNAEEIEADPKAVKQEYDVFISTTPEENVNKMRKLFEDSGTWPREFHYLLDSGKTFDDHFDDAFNQIFDLGYETCLSVGGDIPIIPRDHVVQGFRWLHYYQNVFGKGMVLAPCQACGTSLVGYTKNSGMDHQTVYYNMTGRPALQAYLDKAEPLGLHIALMDAVPDVDNGEDLAHSMTVMNALDFCAKGGQDVFVPYRTLKWVRDHGLTVVTPPNDDFDSRETIDK